MKFQVLVVEDQSGWQEELTRDLQHLTDEKSLVDIAPDRESALHKVRTQTYDLIILDYALKGDPVSPNAGDPPQGIRFIQDLRALDEHQDCGLIILTAHLNTERMKQSLDNETYRIDAFFEKHNFDYRSFQEAARKAIREALIRRSTARAKRRVRLAVRFNSRGLIGSELRGPDVISPPSVTQRRFDSLGLSRQADELNLKILTEGLKGWRPVARSIGQQLYQVLARDQQTFSNLSQTLALASAEEPWLEFISPAVGLGAPFELLRVQERNLCLNSLLTRRVIEDLPSLSHKPEPFRDFLKGLIERQQPLRVLIVGSNGNSAGAGEQLKAEDEVQALAACIRSDLDSLGLKQDITCLAGSEASYSRVRKTLESGRFHLFHFAGHGRHEKDLPEVSGLVLPRGSGKYTIRASELNLLAAKNDFRLVFLNSCFSARTETGPGRGDFHGIFDALVRADVPNILGYRWSVVDHQAMLLARTFYAGLWRSFSPAEALLEARKQAAMRESGLDEDIWAAPILVVQNS